MKNNNYLFISIFLFFTLNSFSQTKSAKIVVDGVCMMCEERIEKKAIDVKGIKLADWNLDNRVLKVVYNEKNITIKRPGNGISPMRWDEIIGTNANKDYSKDELI